MVKKTISHLNTKIWYRFIKVIFIIFLLVFVPLAFLGGFSDAHKSDVTKTIVNCEGGNSYNVYHYNYNIDSISKSNLRKAQSLCRKDGDDGLNPTIELIPKYNQFIALLYGFLLAILVLLVFEVLRRIFYYTILGKLYPRK